MSDINRHLCGVFCACRFPLATRLFACRALLMLLSLAACRGVAAAAAALPSTAPHLDSPIPPGKTAAAICQVNIRGTPTGGISAASMECSGGSTPVTVGVDGLLLRGFKARLTGVEISIRCGMPGCLLTFCGSTRATITNGNISGISSEHIWAVVCATNTTDLTLQRTWVSYNNATALVAFNQSKVVVATSRLAHNQGYKYNGGATGADKAVLIITNQSVVSKNVAHNCSGGGVRAQNASMVIISGGTRVDNNTSHWAGGGVAVKDHSFIHCYTCSSRIMPTLSSQVAAVCAATWARKAVGC